MAEKAPLMCTAPDCADSTKGPVRRFQQTVGAGNHIERIIRLLLSGVVYQQETDTARA